MNTVIIEFNERVKEVYLYFDFLKDIINKEAKLQFKNNNKLKTKQINSELTKMLKANFFLILYNLIESSFKKALEKICNEITSDQVQFRDNIPEIKKIWIKKHYKSFKKRNSDANPEKITKEIDYLLYVIENIANDIVEVSHAKENIGGNVDGKVIRKKFIEYGLSIKPLAKKKTEKLQIVRQRRNDLAHGHISFAKCGRDFSIEDLDDIKKQTISFMRFILKYVNKQLNNSYYIAS